MPEASGPVATDESEEAGIRDTTRHPADPIVQPTVLRPHSPQRNDRRPGSRMNRSSCPAIRQCIRVAPKPTVTWQSNEPAWTIARTVDIAPLADAVAHLEPIDL
jgi:hypothetical protein